MDGKASPCVRIARDLGGELGRREAAFGLPPQARCPIHVMEPTRHTEENVEEFVCRKPRLVEVRIY